MRRREILHVGLASAVLADLGCFKRRHRTMPSGAQLPSLAELAASLRRSEISATMLTEHCLERIALLNRTGPQLRAVIEVNPAALNDAWRRDGGFHRGALHGMPILVKDNIETADAMQTSAGSLALLDAPKPARDAFIVDRLRAAGAVILGKANLSEWANIRSPNSTSGWSARGGLTRNPHKLSHTSSGSSSGSAVAVAAGLAVAAIGTETNGSIVSPASVCGIVGLKPTLGLISRAGVIPITQWQDTPGPMTLTVRDAAWVLNAITGTDLRDPVTVAADRHKPADYESLLGQATLRGIRLGALRSQTGSNPEVIALFEQTLDHLRAAGAVIIDPVVLPNERDAGRLAWKAMLIEFRADLNAYLAKRGGRVRSLAELIAFNEAHRDTEMPFFGQEFFEHAAELGTPEAIAAGKEAREVAARLAGPEGIDVMLQQHQLHAVICPTADPGGKIDLARGDADDHCASTPAAVAGYPHLTVPMGFVDDLPVGLSFIGTAWSEPLLLGLGHAFEQMTPVRRIPKFL